MRIAALIAGIVLTIWTILAVVRAMLVPGGGNSFLGRVVFRSVRWFGNLPLPLMKTYATQNRWLAIMAPLALLSQLIVYMVTLAITFSLIIFGTTDLSYSDAIYQAGSTITTLGITEPVNTASTVAVLLAAFFGVVVIAIFIGYLLNLYSAIVSRESQVARLSILAGEPAWGPEIVARAHAVGFSTISTPNRDTWIDWISEMRLSIAANPTRAEFRSTGKLRHWSVSMLAVMDAVALDVAMTGSANAESVQLLTAGTETLVTFNDPGQRIPTWDLQRQIREAYGISSSEEATQEQWNAAGLTEVDWQAGIKTIQDVDYPLPDDMDVVRNRFLALRAPYVGHAYSLAKKYHAVPAPWSGPRKPALETIWPEIAGSGRHAGRHQERR